MSLKDHLHPTDLLTEIRQAGFNFPPNSLTLVEHPEVSTIKLVSPNQRWNASERTKHPNYYENPWYLWGNGAVLDLTDERNPQYLGIPLPRHIYLSTLKPDTNPPQIQGSVLWLQDPGREHSWAVIWCYHDQIQVATRRSFGLDGDSQHPESRTHKINQLVRQRLRGYTHDSPFLYVGIPHDLSQVILYAAFDRRTHDRLHISEHRQLGNQFNLAQPTNCILFPDYQTFKKSFTPPKGRNWVEFLDTGYRCQLLK